jgi:hypothetical protein
MRPAVEIATISAIFLAGMGTIRWLIARTKRDPVERERKRRLHVGGQGRIVDGSIIDVIDASVLYSYTVAGVEYQCAQDLSALRDSVPEAIESLIGPVTVKYLPANPGNSIIMCESWCGFRARPARTLPKGA